MKENRVDGLIKQRARGANQVLMPSTDDRNPELWTQLDRYLLFRIKLDSTFQCVNSIFFITCELSSTVHPEIGIKPVILIKIF
jgi:hypothetical protein